MQNSYTKEGQLSWWLALLECLWIHKGRPLPFKTQKHFNFYPKPAQPAQLEGPRAGPRALDLSRAQPGPLETLKRLKVFIREEMVVLPISVHSTRDIVS